MLDPFIRSQIKALQSGPGRPPKPVTCHRVTRTAAVSVAGHAGITAGDLLVFLDGGPASKADPKLYKQRAGKRLYTFYSPSRGQQVELACTGIDIGVELARTDEAIKARYKATQPDLESLTELWSNRAHPQLLELAAATVATPGWRDTPALLFEGVGLWEAGRHQEGLTRISAYLQNHRENWTMNYAAIGLYYLALEQLRRGHRDEGIDRLEQAFAQERLPRIADAIEQQTGTRPPLTVVKWAGQAWPAKYTLPVLEGPPGRVSLADTLVTMNEGSLLVVCLLATFRSNGPYGEFLERWLNYAAWFGPFVHGLHVITMTNERYQDHSWQYGLEAAVRETGGRFALLHDKEGDAHMPLEPDRSPMIFALNRRGTIVYEGDLDPVDWWDAVGRISGV